ncbi:3'-5' exonuclease [Corynebacterium glutamicum]|uniref:DNA polymerase III subunit epsilon n=2 Tax=Corynebacterium glutamicum TaxID=1718 RepID=A0AB36IB63_CORGT|nr:3'-5' exonuclease [Corynebacterium glutamicum]AGN18984.1 DNA polymerase III subunit epsilon [Corynebacterium glutamicum SCgG1]AGN22007.1 DNA polymerase III subunit epsilon [Corynebacterium glutamicum SCgG2]EGV41317.1 DNA polymerase III subunit epsilon [Corynebacterium glutamicum S9114]EOA65351.1 DNA polymerase III subunit epsilon [Corynebacterium glutamicum MT]EPP41013.1 DNA polymerase III subunit epsilon [Corynebacterium glutamicum Z188]
MNSPSNPAPTVPSFDTTKMLSFDLETTGVNPFDTRIVTSAMVTITSKGAEPIELLADPGIEIPEAATAVHGITTEHARANGRPHDEVLAETISRLRAGWQAGLSVIVFNASYDLTVLRNHDPSFTIDGLVYDPFVIDKVKDRYRKGKRTLTDMCAHYDVQLGNAHEATSDALAAARIAWKQVRLWPELTKMTGEELMEFQAVNYYEQQKSFRSYLIGQGRDASDVNTSWPVQTDPAS